METVYMTLKVVESPRTTTAVKLYPDSAEYEPLACTHTLTERALPESSTNASISEASMSFVRLAAAEPDMNHTHFVYDRQTWFAADGLKLVPYFSRARPLKTSNSGQYLCTKARSCLPVNCSLPAIFCSGTSSYQGWKAHASSN